MSEILSVNSLDGYTQPRMVYRFAFGAASKSYTITLPATPRNVVALAGKIRQRATLTIDGITQIGWLLLTSEDTTAGVFEVVFVTANGDLWQRRSNDKLSDVNLSEFDFTYDRTTVNDSETAAAPFVLFDVADRGAFRTPDAIDITERYPALRVATLTDRVFRHLGTSPVVEDRRGDWRELYLLFTQSNEVRGTADWARDAIMRAYDDSYNQWNNTQGAGAMTWSYTAELTEVQDVGGNYSAGVYLVPQDGTYTFRVNFNRILGTFEDDMGGPASLSYDWTANRARVTVAIERNGSAISRWSNIETVTAGTIDIGAKQIDLHPIELTNGDEIRVRVTIEATVSFPFGGTQSRFAVLIDRAELTNNVSHWYGAGSQVAVRDIVPDMTVNEYIRWMVEVLGVEVYHDQLAARTYVRYGGIDQTPAARVENYERLTIGNDAPANVQLIYRTDKAAPPPNEAYIIDESLDTERKEIPVSRTRFAHCGRLLGYNYGHEVPTLWQAGNPLDQSQATMPPAHQTTAAMRVVRRLPNAMAAVSFRQTFAGSLAQTEEFKTRLVRFAEVDHWQLLAPRALRVRQTVELVARVNVANLIGGSWFRRPLHVAGQLVELIEAEQLNGDVYRLRGATLALYSGVQRVELPVTTVPDTTPQGGGSGTVTAVPADELWTAYGIAGMITTRRVRINHNDVAGSIEITGERPIVANATPTSVIGVYADMAGAWPSYTGAERGIVQFRMTDGANPIRGSIGLAVDGSTEPYTPWLIFETAGNERASIRGDDLHIHANGAGVVLRSPSGIRYRITVDNSGNVIATMI